MLRYSFALMVCYKQGASASRLLCNGEKRLDFAPVRLEAIDLVCDPDELDGLSGPHAYALETSAFCARRPSFC
ncbi:MAG: hypothetical protein IKF72_08460 [Kiritimatiellae bacterium]|nr:hypothetical protein [Kiritimatiellia bacterium]